MRRPTERCQWYFINVTEQQSCHRLSNAEAEIMQDINRLNRCRYVILLRYSLLRTEANIYKAYPESRVFGDTFLRCLLSNCLLPSLEGGVVCTYFPTLLFPYRMSHHRGQPAVVSFVHACVIKEHTGRHISVGW